jgi:hypothetical protein
MAAEKREGKLDSNAAIAQSFYKSNLYASINS